MMSFACPPDLGGLGKTVEASNGLHDCQLAVHLAQNEPKSGNEKAFREAIVACGRARQPCRTHSRAAKLPASTASMP